MHKFLRAIGFSDVKTREQLLKLIKKSTEDASESRCSIYNDEILYGDYYCECGENMGIAVCGEYNSMDEFSFEHYFPYFDGSHISSMERSVIERHAANLSFAGVCEDNKIGISIIYYLQNRIEYMKASVDGNPALKKAPVWLSGLSDGGMIMMPLAKTETAKKKVSHSDKKRDKLIKAAREGNEEAIESLTLDDIDVYSRISTKIKEMDVYTIVDTYFMPFGVECDQYSVLGEIEDLRKVENIYTGEEIWQMSLLCNGVPMDICINKADLYGEPEIGRRFKGSIWLQGYLEI